MRATKASYVVVYRAPSLSFVFFSFANSNDPPSSSKPGESPQFPRPSSSVVLFSVLIGVRLRGFLSVVGSIQMMAMCDMGMMSALFMRSFFVMSGRLLVMAGRVLVMFSGLLMMFRSFVLRHFAFSIC
jgi:hypothetical protein